MSLFMSGTDARFGALNISPFITPPPLPNILSEWAGLLPLAVHLASYRDDYAIVGELALSGRLSVGLFPKLGTLCAYSRLLTQGRRFMDGASLHASVNRQVWDIKWGSVFPAANGAASTRILDYAISAVDKILPISMPETFPRQKGETVKAASSPAQRDTSSELLASTTSADVLVNDTPKETPPRETPSKATYRRYQTLYVLQYDQGPQPKSLWRYFEKVRKAVYYNIAAFLLSLAMAVVLSLCGLYGTATIILIGAISRLLSLSIDIRRPPDYLQNNESHDAYMLTAAHPNALEWYLFTGNRGVVDSLLNKPMLEIPSNHLHRTSIAANWFRIAHMLQLAAMTFTAAQKGWDGIALAILVMLDRSLRWLFMGPGLVRRWLDTEGVQVQAKCFKFTGRGIMLGAMQLQSNSKITRWMDDILVPHPRREAFLKCLLEGQSCFETATTSLQESDKSWVEIASRLSHASAEVLEKETLMSEILMMGKREG